MSAATLRIITARLAILAFVLLAWQYLPVIFAASHSVILNPIFISTPEKIAADLYQIIVTGLIFPALWSTVSASLIGLVLGVVVGYAMALLFSEFKAVERVLMIY